MLAVQNLLAAFTRVNDYWSPKVIGKVNEELLKAAKIKGQLVWHGRSGVSGMDAIPALCRRA